MTIKDHLKKLNYYAPSTLFQVAHNERLKRNLADISGNGWPFFYYLCEREVAGGHPMVAWHPDRVAALAEKYSGSPMLEDLEKWLEKCEAFGTLELVRTMATPLDFQGEEPLPYSYAEIRAFIRATSELKDADTELWDSEFLVPTKNQCQMILAASPSHRFQYVTNRRDCDKFMRILRGWTAEQGYGNLTVGACIFTAYDEAGKVVFSHAVNIFIYRKEDGSLGAMLGEPQTAGRMWELDEVEPGQQTRVTRVEYTDIIF